MTGGTAALLFSDIEGSTRLLQQLGPAYAEVLVDHRRLLRSAFAAYDGTERGTEGDSFFVTFPTAAQAAAAALAGQLALAGHGWPADSSVRVRMGLHVGVIQPIADTVVGMAVHEAARICSAAHGAQVLASDVFVRLATPAPDDVGWTALGEHQLKDLPVPVRLHQMSHPGLPAVFPAPRSAGSSRANLPAQPTAFVGRAADLQHVHDLLRSSRLLTVTGTGGVGKSRIALRVAANAVVDYREGVWFVDLAPVMDPEGVAEAVALSLGIQAKRSEDLLTEIGQQRLLLLVDNCEHLITSVSDLITTLLRGCPNVSVLATSREPLGVPGEVVWRVPPLSLDDAVALLTVRAQAVNETFAVTDANRAAVEAVCRRLDAVPLALELAAARLTSLSAQQLEARLDQRFRLLAGGVRGVVERHRTLQATLDWSYNLLAADEQAVLRSTGVFAGTFPLFAVEQVAADFDPIDVDVLVDKLVSKSLVIVENRDSEPRYRLLETVRQYALDQLVRLDEAVNARTSHLRWVTGVIQAAARTLWLGGDEVTWLAQLDAEDANIHSALDWALETNDMSAAAAIVFGGVGWFVSRGRSAEGLRLAQQVLAAGPSGVDEALVAVAEMSLASGCGRLERAMVDRVVATAERLAGTSYDWVRHLALAHAAAWSYDAGDVAGANAAVATCAQLVEQARDYGPGARAWSLQPLFWANLDSGRTDDARVAAEEALAAATAAHLSILESRMAFNRARISFAQGNHDEAWDYAEHAVRVARATGEAFVVAAATRLMADVAEARHDRALARDLLASIIDAVAESMTQADADEVLAKVAALSP